MYGPDNNSQMCIAELQSPQGGTEHLANDHLEIHTFLKTAITFLESPNSRFIRVLSEVQKWNLELLHSSRSWSAAFAIFVENHRFGEFR